MKWMKNQFRELNKKCKNFQFLDELKSRNCSNFKGNERNSEQLTGCTTCAPGSRTLRRKLQFDLEAYAASDAPGSE